MVDRSPEPSTNRTLSLGAIRDANSCVHFRIWAPQLTSVKVVFPKSSVLPIELTQTSDGYFEGQLPNCPDDLQYKLQTESGQEYPDPISNYQPSGVYGPSQIVDHHGFKWTDTNWTGQPLEELVIYELHIGTFAPEGTFRSAATLLPYLAELGINAVELMPVAQFSGKRNWGYDGVFPFAPQNSYGAPEEFKSFINTAHQLGISVLLDVVYNHLGPEGNCFGEFGPYFTDRYTTPWGDAINFDGPYSDEVRKCVIENALHWHARYHVDGFRVDAIQAVYDSSPQHILSELCQALHEHAASTGKTVHLIAESDANDARVVEGPKVRGYGFDAQWADDYHLASHAFLTGERHGLYKDFGTLPALGKVVKDNLFLDGIYSQFRCRRHGAPASHLPSHKFIAFNQNHDFIGNRVNGDRFAATSPIDKQKCALSLLLLSPFVPLIFMGEEYGEIAPFHYFVDHQDPDLIEQVRAGRIRDLRQFWSSPRPQDPHTPETFNASRLMLGRRHTPAGQALLSLVKDLIDVRRSFPQALSLANRDVRIDDSRSVFCLDYEFNNQAKFKLAANFGRQRIPLSGIVDSSWQLELSTAWEQYSVAPTKPKDDTSLMPLTAEVYRAK